MKGPLTEKQKKDVIDLINFIFDCPPAIKVVKEDEKYVYLLHENGEVSKWDKDEAVGDD